MINKITCFDKYGKPHQIDKEAIEWRVSVAGVLKKGNAILLIKHPKTLKWETPGGGVEIGESISEALVREFEEEVGIKISVDKFITYEESFYYIESQKKAFQTLRLFFYVSKLDDEIPQDSTFVQIESLTKENCNELTFNIIPLITTE